MVVSAHLHANFQSVSSPLSVSQVLENEITTAMNLWLLLNLSNSMKRAELFSSIKLAEINRRLDAVDRWYNSAALVLPFLHVHVVGFNMKLCQSMLIHRMLKILTFYNTKCFFFLHSNELLLEIPSVLQQTLFSFTVIFM